MKKISSKILRLRVMVFCQSKTVIQNQVDKDSF